MIKKLLSTFILLILFSLIGCVPSEETNREVIENPTTDDYIGQGMITFSYDDGRLNNFEYALPLHVKHNVPATFNIVAKRVDKENQASTETLLDAQNKGIEIASHGYSHIILTSLSDEELDFELSESKRVLSDIVGNVDTISIPGSQYDARVRESVGKYYKGARVFGGQPNVISSIDFLWLKSYVVLNSNNFEKIQALIDQAVRDKTWVIIMLHGVEPVNELKYDITPDLLDEVLAYVNSYDKDELLPVNTIDGILFIAERLQP